MTKETLEIVTATGVVCPGVGREIEGKPFLSCSGTQLVNAIVQHSKYGLTNVLCPYIDQEGLECTRQPRESERAPCPYSRR